MHIDMKIIAKRDEVLSTLRMNRIEHQQIVLEARDGYMVKAREALAAKLDQLQSGKLVALQFGLMLPQDHTAEYDAAIRMLELHQSADIELDASLVRCLVMNEWPWLDSFIGSNMAYSSLAASKFKG